MQTFSCVSFPFPTVTPYETQFQRAEQARTATNLSGAGESPGTEVFHQVLVDHGDASNSDESDMETGATDTEDDIVTTYSTPVSSHTRTQGRLIPLNLLPLGTTYTSSKISYTINQWTII